MANYINIVEQQPQGQQYDQQNQRNNSCIIMNQRVNNNQDVHVVHIIPPDDDGNHDTNVEVVRHRPPASDDLSDASDADRVGLAASDKYTKRRRCASEDGSDVGVEGHAVSPACQYALSEVQC
jgi:hypothetical protein